MTVENIAADSLNGEKKTQPKSLEMQIILYYYIIAMNYKLTGVNITKLIFTISCTDLQFKESFTEWDLMII